MSSTLSPAARTRWRWTGYVAIAIVFAIVCAFLSHWQFSRNSARSAELALVELNYDADAVPVEEMIPEPDVFTAGDEWHPVTLQGRYIQNEQLLVRNRARGGTSAFEVLVPFQLEDGRVFLVDRGWVPPGEGALPEDIPEAPTGEVTVTARIREGEALPTSGRSAPEGQVPTINLELIDEMLDADIDTSAYLLMDSEEPAPATSPNSIDSPSDDPGPYLSYAVQWILFAIMGFIFIGYIIRTELRHRREDEDEDDDPEDDEPVQGRPRRAIFTRGRDQDMDDEDALLDHVR
ncbi:cytochrome oxidase assembly protein ShyY1 [Microbacterium endophyticum]|uniref:SURF1-like protein n=1 Tax=Microbacterium endophyticum TaxID=1526412 RepID=A0A7W4V4W0_9MICO|nr:SURF1 family protein [Microbacterium endophyticum]MBB2976754.1 cytochrome oxidase assembly protein ShyY1 [Microbacterium endophyticum]NIK36609.1 cytochrome oxidase assembly protein ShyY1 [Microbacterium endophyticum]